MRILFVLAALLGVSLGYEDKTVVQYLQDNGFTVLSKLINDAGLASTLSASGTYKKELLNLKTDHSAIFPTWEQ